MRILMLGNSYTFANDLPQMLAERLDAEVVHHTRGGVRLAEQLNSNTKMGARTQAALQNEAWDYVILQEMSNGPITSKEKFLQSVSALCAQIRENGAVPVLYATWAYERGGKPLEKFGMGYDEMALAMQDSYRRAAQENAALLAEAGKAFYDRADEEELYAADGSHPNKTGSCLAAQVITDTILKSPS